MNKGCTNLIKVTQRKYTGNLYQTINMFEIKECIIEHAGKCRKILTICIKNLLKSKNDSL